MAKLKPLMMEKIETGIPGFEHITKGGLPKGRTCLLLGPAGSAKTVFGVQFLIEGIRKFEEGGIFVTFEESPEDIRRNMMGFGWDIEKLESEGKWAFVDASFIVEQEVIEIGNYDLGALLVRIEYAITKVKAKRISLDSLGAIFGQLSNADMVRRELNRILISLKKMDVTSFITSEMTTQGDVSTRYGVEEFVVDNVIILRNTLTEEKRRRTIEILKFRGTDHSKGEFPFSIIPERGIVIIPLSDIKLKQHSSNTRVSSGNKILDKMCGGGFFRDSVILLSGATGTGKTLLLSEFLNYGCENGETCLLFAYEESRDQMYRNAYGWGMDFERLEREGKLKVICNYPEAHGLEDHLIQIKDFVEKYNPKRIVIDSLSALERVSTEKSFKEFIIGLTSFIKHQEVTGVFSSTTPNLFGGNSVTEAHISTITDSIILLRYVEIFGEMHRGITVLKMRGSYHDKNINEYLIDGKGMHIGSQFKNISGILTGSQMHIMEHEITRLDKMFTEEN